MVEQSPNVGLLQRGAERGRSHPFDESAQVLGQAVEGGGVANGREGVALLAEFDAFTSGAAFDSHGSS